MVLICWAFGVFSVGKGFIRGRVNLTSVAGDCASHRGYAARKSQDWPGSGVVRRSAAQRLNKPLATKELSLREFIYDFTS